MSPHVYFRRTSSLAASCAFHLALVAVVAGLVPSWTPRAPAVLEAEIVEAERPAPPREVAGLRPRVAASRPTVLPRLVEAPKLPTSLPEPAPAPVVPEPATAPSPPLLVPAAPAPAPTPASRESFAIAATEPPGTSAELKATTDKPAPAVPPPSAMAKVRVYVAADGRVADVQVDQSAGHADLDRAAVDAVRRWTFEPGRRGSGPIGMWVRVPVRFVLK